MEAIVTIKFSESFYAKKVNKTVEYLGLAIANAITAILGILPVGFPISRNIVGFQTGANHRIFHFFNFVIMGFIFMVLLPFLKYIPTSVLKSLNLTTACIIMEVPRLFSFG